MTDNTKKALERMGYTGTPGELIRSRWHNDDGYYGRQVTVAVVDGDPFVYLLERQEFTIHGRLWLTLSLHQAFESDMIAHLPEEIDDDGIVLSRTSLTLEKNAWNEIRRMSEQMRLQPIAAMLRLA